MKTEQQIIRNAGFKITVPRLLVLEALRVCEKQGEHLSAEALFRRILADGGHLSLAAVYRILAQFEAAGLVTRHQFFTDSNRAVYQLANSSKHHHHMVCADTGDILEFNHNALEKMENEIAAAHGFEIINSQVVFHVRKIGTR